jgi:hypothetical protein
LSASLHPTAALRTNFFLAAVTLTAFIAQCLLDFGAHVCPRLDRSTLYSPQRDLVSLRSLRQYLINDFFRFRYQPRPQFLVGHRLFCPSSHFSLFYARNKLKYTQVLRRAKLGSLAFKWAAG